MQFSKSSLRKKAISERKKKYLKIKNFDFKKIFKLINKFFLKKNITIAGYYPSNHFSDVLKKRKTVKSILSQLTDVQKNTKTVKFAKL